MVIRLVVLSTDAFNEGEHSSIDQAYIDGVMEHLANIFGLLLLVYQKQMPTHDGVAHVHLLVHHNHHCMLETIFFCESGNPLTTYENTGNFRYVDDPLWDGKRCDSEGQCCSNANSPPWFSVDLPDETNETIEIRICSQDGINNEGGQAPPRFSGSIHVCILWAYMLFETDITLTLIVN